MSLDNRSKSNARPDTAKKPDTKDDPNVSSKDADQVKGGVVPQPEPSAQTPKKVF